MDTQIDTAQRRAEAFYNSLLKSAGVLGYETPNGRYKRLQLLAKHDAETRHAALEEASNVVKAYGEKMNAFPNTTCNIRPAHIENLVAALDRLREGVERE